MGLLNSKYTDYTDRYNSQMKKYFLNLRMNLDVDITDATKLKLSMLGMLRETKRPTTSEATLFEQIFNTPSAAFPVQTQNGFWGSNNVLKTNPIANLADVGYYKLNQRMLQADLRLVQDLSVLTRGLSVELAIAYDNNATYQETAKKSFMYQTIEKGTDGEPIYTNYGNPNDELEISNKGLANQYIHANFDTEFTYQLLQGYDFLHLYETKNCKLQLGGSDQWGNITTGAELIRRTNGGEVFALTCPLVTKADGTKFGKTESGNVWLDARYTSPYKFYQFWLNVSDEDAKRYIKIFTSISKEEIEALSAEHDEAPHLRVLQKRLAKEVTVMVHSEADYEAAVEASNILFGNSTSEQLHKLDEDTLLAVFEGVPQFEISRNTVLAGIPAVELTTEVAAIFPSKGEMRKLTQGGGVSINKEKLAAPDTKIDATYLLNNKYIIVQRGKKNYYLLIAK